MQEKNKIPFLGICLGMQMTVVEYARDVLGLKDANSQEFDEKSKNQVIHIMENQKSVNKKGGTMRLGSYPCSIKRRNISRKSIWKEEINERHRHRFEYNNDYKEKIRKAGLICSGTSPDGELVEIVEISKRTSIFYSRTISSRIKIKTKQTSTIICGISKSCERNKSVKRKEML